MIKVITQRICDKCGKVIKEDYDFLSPSCKLTIERNAKKRNRELVFNINENEVKSIPITGGLCKECAYSFYNELNKLVKKYNIG